MIKNDNLASLIKSYDANDISEISKAFSGNSYSVLKQIKVFGNKDYLHYKYDDTFAPEGPTEFDVKATHDKILTRIKSSSKKSFNIDMTLPPIEDGVIWGYRGLSLSLDLLPELLIGVELDELHYDGNMLCVYFLAPKKHKGFDSLINSVRLGLSTLSCIGYWNVNIPEKLIPSVNSEEMIQKMIYETATWKTYLEMKNKKTDF